MSTPSFDRLLYTDCRPGEGLGGGGGYQVQAQSAGCTSSQVRMAVSWLLYSTQAKWVNAGRSVEQFPRGLSHSGDAGFGTAQSRYLGTEVNGNRQGNYVTDCILTPQVEPYGVIRPAQLWEAPFWREEIWPSTTAPHLDDDLDIGPLDTDAIADWLHADPRRAAGLERLVTVLEDPDGPRVIIRSETPEAALSWIAAGTILLPMPEALAVSFRVFANNVDDAAHRIVAVPADLHRNLAPGSRPRTFIIDDATSATDELEPSPRASYWVRRLAAADEPYDVVEAVALAAELGGDSAQDRSDAQHAAMAVVDPDASIEDSRGVGRWVRRAIGSEHDAQAQAVVARLVAADEVRIDDLRLLDGLAADRTIAVEPARLRSRLLLAEVEEVRAGVAPPWERLTPVAFSMAQQADATSALVSAMLVGSDAEMDLLLRLGSRHRLDLLPPSPALVDRLRTFVDGWLATPSVVYRPESWALRDLLMDELHGRLRGIWASGDHATLERILRSVITYLIRREGDFSDPFGFEIEACHTATLDPAGRVARTQEVLHVLRTSGRDESFHRYQDALVRWYAADPETCLDMVGRIPASVALHKTVQKNASRELAARAQTHVDATLLSAIEGLDARGALPDGGRLQKIARSAAAVEALLAKLDGDASIGDLQRIVPALRAVREADHEVVELSMPALVDAAFQAKYGQLGQSMLRYLREPAALSFAQWWAHNLSKPRLGYRAAAYALAWIGDQSIPADARHELTRQLVAHHHQMPPPEGDAWRQAVANNLTSPDERLVLDQLLDGDAGPRRRTRMFRKDA